MADLAADEYAAWCRSLTPSRRLDVFNTLHNTLLAPKVAGEVTVAALRTALRDVLEETWATRGLDSPGIVPAVVERLMRTVQKGT